MLEGAEKLPDTAHLSTLSDFIITDNFSKDIERKCVGYDCVTDPLFLQMGPKGKTMDTDNICKTITAGKLNGIN